MLVVDQFIGNESSHVDGTAATGALSARVVWSIGKCLVRAGERAQRSAGAEPHLLWTIADHHRFDFVQQVLVRSRFVQQNVYACLFSEVIKLWFSKKCLQRRPANSSLSKCQSVSAMHDNDDSDDSSHNHNGNNDHHHHQ